MKVSFVLLTYNQLENITKPCIASLYKYTDVNDFELIIVDNNSKDNTQDYLKTLKQEKNNVKIVLNKNNRGFAGGMNDGIKIASGEYVVLLNNDLLFSPNWLDNLLFPFSHEKNIGLCGPLTNNSENEQEIDIENINENNYVEFTKKILNDFGNKYFETKRLVFFCVAIKKEVLNKIGLLDENYERGFYEDDDFSKRAIATGYKLVIAESSFVYHHCGASFTKNDDFYITELLKRNRKIFSKKHKMYSIYTAPAISFLDKLKSDLNDSGVDINTSLRLKRFKWHLERAEEREIFLTKKYESGFVKAIFNVCKENCKLLRKIDYLIRNLKKK